MQKRIGDIMLKMHNLEQPPKNKPLVNNFPDSQIELQGQAGSILNNPLTRAATTNNTRSDFRQGLEALVQNSAGKHGVSADLIKAVINAESGGRVDARSPAGALGLMQLMPKTAQQLGVDPLNPAANIDGGTRYLKTMAKKFGTLDKALAAYNSGPGTLKKFQGIPPYKETHNYIRQIRQQLSGNKIDLRR